jgi:streptogramin lyase
MVLVLWPNRLVCGNRGDRHHMRIPQQLMSAPGCAVFILLSILAMAAGADAAPVSGTVTGPDGKPVVMALVSVISADGLYSETSYSGPDGRYELPTTITGKAQLRVRGAGFRDATHPLQLTSAQSLSSNVRLAPLERAEEISDSLTASSHFPRVSLLGDERAQKLFRNDCVGCHQLGNAFTRRPRGAEGWRSLVRLMLSNWAVEEGYKAKLGAQYARMLDASFEGKPVVKREVQVYDPALKNVVIREWKLLGGVMPHDVEEYSRDGRLYSPDSGNDQMFSIDTVTNQVKTTLLPANGMPMGGRLAAGPSLMTEAHHGVHSLQEGKDGKFYLTACFANQVGEFDPATGAYQALDVPQGLCPHTARFDPLGQLWFTVAISNQVARFDPGSRAITMIALPAHSNRPHFPFPMPYGIDVNPRDGSIWYAALTAHKLGRIDAQTLAVKEFDSPYIGPRRLRFSAEGVLWVPEFGEGGIARVDTQTLHHKFYKIPTLTPDGAETPYALAVHPRTQDVWVTANLSDRIFRFVPGQERFIAYPLPTRGSYMRDMIFPRKGGVCSTSSPPLPAATMEGGAPTLVCISGADTPTAAAERPTKAY